MTTTSASLKTPIIVASMETDKCFAYFAGNCSTRDRKTPVGTKKRHAKEIKKGKHNYHFRSDARPTANTLNRGLKLRPVQQNTLKSNAHPKSSIYIK